MNRHRPEKPIRVGTHFRKAVGSFDCGFWLRHELDALKEERARLQYRIDAREKELRQLEGLELVSYHFLGSDGKWSFYRTSTSGNIR